MSVRLLPGLDSGPVAEQLLQARLQADRFGGFTFPDSNDPPSAAFQAARVFTVALRIAFQFFTPPFASGFRDTRILAVTVPVPEAPVHENHGRIAFQHDVRPALKSGRMESEAQTEPVYQRADEDLGLGVFTAYLTHVVAALSFGEAVSHFRGRLRN